MLCRTQENWRSFQIIVFASFETSSIILNSFDYKEVLLSTDYLQANVKVFLLSETLMRATTLNKTDIKRDEGQREKCFNQLT